MGNWGQTHKNNFTTRWRTFVQILMPILRWSYLLHDIGKHQLNVLIKKTWTFHGHEFWVEKWLKIFERLHMPWTKNEICSKWLSWVHDLLFYRKGHPTRTFVWFEKDVDENLMLVRLTLPLKSIKFKKKS
jgi:hypothetical protein